MNFIDAVKLAESNGHLVGREYKGGTIDELIIVPTSEKGSQQFFEHYYQTGNAKAAIAPFVGEDVTVSVVLDKHRFMEGAVFLQSLFTLSEELGVVIG